jgi:hypothetical protein
MAGRRLVEFALRLCIILVLLLSAGIVVMIISGLRKPAPGDPGNSQENRADDWERLRPKVKLGKVPAIALGPRKPITQEKASEIKACIARLASIDSPDFGLSATISGEAFLPLPGQRRGYAMILTDHRLKSSADLKTLVEMGPDALPFLLDAIGDKTPTKIKIEHGGCDGAMWFANELWGNPVNESEAKVLGPPKHLQGALREEKCVETYTVKVGDVCLVAIGQIAGRGYHAVRYQPTACIVVNSPTEDAELREQVRKIWSSNDPARKLLDALLLDYATEGVFQGPSLGSWGLGSELQIQAAMRLLYYYPKETVALISERLGRLNIERTSAHGKGSPATEEELDAYIRREVANGVRTDDFVKAVSWCPERKIREATRAIFMRTNDVDILLAALPGMEETDRDLIRNRLQTFLDSVPAEEGGAYGDGYNLLVALANRLGDDAVPAFERYLRKASAQRCHSAAQALRNFNGEWCMAILYGLLWDRRPVGGYSYAVDPNDQDKRLPIRVCDAAAETLHMHRPELGFALEGDYKDLDEQIRVILDQTAAERQ